MEVKPPGDAKDLCHFLGQSAVLEVLEVLAGSPCSVGAVAQALKLDVGRASRVLRALRLRGYVECSSDKKEHVYRLSRSIEVQPTRESLVVIAPSASGARIRIEMRSLGTLSGIPAADPVE